VPTIRPIAHDARLSIIDHLDELRTHVLWIVVVYIFAFAFCFSQNDHILNQLNKPLAAAKSVDCSKPRSDANALEQSGCFSEELQKALDVSAPALVSAGRALVGVARTDGVSAAAKAQSVAAAASLQVAARALERAAATAPKATSSKNVRPVTLGVTEPFLTTITVAGYAALLLTMPFLLLRVYIFVLPAFTPSEKRLAVPVMVSAPILFIGGVAFGYFLAMPRAIEFLQNYNDGQYDILVQARDYYRFTMVLLAGFGVLFQIPLAVLAVVRLQVLTPAQLRATRGYALLLFAILAAVVTPTPDPVTMLLAMAPLVLLYEASIQLSRFIVPSGPSRWSLRFRDDDDDGDDESELPLAPPDRDAQTAPPDGLD